MSNIQNVTVIRLGILKWNVVECYSAKQSLGLSPCQRSRGQQDLFSTQRFKFDSRRLLGAN